MSSQKLIQLRDCKGLNSSRHHGNQCKLFIDKIPLFD
jgi:hypothetical protein